MLKMAQPWKRIGLFWMISLESRSVTNHFVGHIFVERFVCKAEMYEIDLNTL